MGKSGILNKDADKHKVAQQRLHRAYIYPAFVELKSWGYPASAAALYACPIEVPQTGITMSTGQLSFQRAFLNWVYKICQ